MLKKNSNIHTMIVEQIKDVEISYSDYHHCRHGHDRRYHLRSQQH